MISFFANRFIEKKTFPTTAAKREAYGKLCGIAGIVLNFFLFLGKILAGLLSGSIAIMADAFNNLSDTASSVITLIGFRLAGQKPDHEHPFGHGRIEYISGLIVAMIIVLMGLELLKSSVEKILHPEVPAMSAAILIILACAILVKLYMAYYNHRIGKQIQSPAVSATAVDSLSDCVSTGFVLIATVIGHYTHLAIDGWCGLIVSILILFAGFKAAKDTIDPLLGQPPAPEFIAQIQEIVLSYPEITAIHDLIVHNYGPGRVIISLHAEVPQDADMLSIHDVIDNAERHLAAELNCVAVIHMDPIAVNDPQTLRLKAVTAELVRRIDETLSIHDFRIVTGPTRTNLIFDIQLSETCRYTKFELQIMVESRIKDYLGSRYFTIIQVDDVYH